MLQNTYISKKKIQKKTMHQGFHKNIKKHHCFQHW